MSAGTNLSDPWFWAWAFSSVVAVGLYLFARAYKKLAHDAIEQIGDDPDSHGEIPQAVHERGWQWRPVGDGAFAPPFGTIRVCIACGCLVAGGPTRCVRCAKAATP